MRDKLTSILADVLQTSSLPPFDECTAERLSDWDSIAHLNLILSIEGAFGVSFPLEDVVELHSLTAMESALTRLGVAH